MNKLLNWWLDIWDTRLDWKVQLMWPILYSLAIVGTMIIWRKENNAIQIIGIAITGASFALMIMARFQLKDSFSTKARAPNKLITTGLFSKVRHPIYLSASLAFGGLVFYLQDAMACEHKNYVIIPAFLLYVYLQKKRVRKENKLLYDKFGETYGEYSAKTWF